MSLIKELAEIFTARREEKRQFEAAHRIEFAFKSGGKKYYQFTDTFNMPYERGVAAIMVYNELDCKINRELLLRYTKRVNEILTSKNIDIYELKALNDMLRDRLALKTDVELLYKLASVVYFDKTENPYSYDQEYATKKIGKWKKDQSLQSFFSQKPLTELVPYLKSASSGLDAYSALQTEIDKLHNDLISYGIYKKQPTPSNASATSLKKNTAKRKHKPSTTSAAD